MGQVEKSALIILGPQGSGKGTQAQILAKKLGAERFEMGAKLREVKDRGDKFGNQVSAIIDAGNYVPDWMVEKVFKDYFAAGNHPKLVFDGVPRTLEQAVIFDQVLKSQSFPPPIVVHLKLSDQTAIRRLTLRAREDDSVEVIKNRLKNHYQLTGPVIERYRQKGQLLEIDGEPPIEPVTKSIVEVLKQKGIDVD